MSLRKWINLIEAVVSFADHQPEPEDMTPDVRLGQYTVHAAKKSPESEKKLDYWVWIEGPDGGDPERQIDIRRFAGPEPAKLLGLPDSDDPKQAVGAFTGVVKRATTLAGYGIEKPPELRWNPAWVTWRRQAIMGLLRASGLTR